MGYAHGQKWTEEKIISEIKSAQKFLNITRMPTRSELSLVFGNSSLYNKIAKSGGFMLWANRLNLNIKDSDSKQGWKYEDYVLESIKHEIKIKAELTTAKHPYDIYTENGVKIDVKASKPYSNGSFIFRLEKTPPTCDIYCLCCLPTKTENLSIYVIPSILLNQTQLNFHPSQWNQFYEEWEIIKKYDDFLKTFGIY